MELPANLLDLTISFGVLKTKSINQCRWSFSPTNCVCLCSCSTYSWYIRLLNIPNPSLARGQKLSARAPQVQRPYRSVWCLCMLIWLIYLYVSRLDFYLLSALVCDSWIYSENNKNHTPNLDTIHTFSLGFARRVYSRAHPGDISGWRT